jgi:hypothetical protein
MNHGSAWVRLGERGVVIVGCYWLSSIGNPCVNSAG